MHNLCAIIQQQFSASRQRRTGLGLALVSLSLSWSAWGADLVASAVNSGGGSSQSAAYSLRLSVGEMAGTAAGTNSSLQAGFLAQVAGSPGATVPTAAFTLTPSTLTPGGSVTFTDVSTGTISNRFWNFGDGSTTNLTDTIVVHTYAAVGTNRVTLIVSGSAGSSTNTQANAVIVNNLPTVATPTITPNGGLFTNSVAVTLSCGTAGATLRYTTDGSVPNSNSTAASALTLSNSVTLQVVAFQAGANPSAVASADFIRVVPTVATPTITPNGGVFINPVPVTLSCSTAGATVRYTTDGSVPNSNSTAASALTLSNSVTLHVAAFQAGANPSAVASASFTINSGSTPVAITAYANPSNGGTVSGGGLYPAGTPVQLVATANQSWAFRGWSDGNVQNPRTINVPPGGGSYTANFQVVFVDSAPVILTPPSITNSLLVISNRFVIVVGETNVFTVGAADPVDNSRLRYQWRFGDGGTSAWSAAAVATHVYATTNCGVYTAGVTVSNTQFATSSNLTVCAACQLTLPKLQLGLNFAKLNLDKCSSTGKLGLPGITNLTQLTGQTLVMDLGNVQAAFHLDAKGRGVSSVGICRLAYTKPTKTKPSYWTVTVALSKGNWRAQWAAYGLDNLTHRSPGIRVMLPVAVLVGDEAFAAERPLQYIATHNKTGTASLSK